MFKFQGINVMKYKELLENLVIKIKSPSNRINEEIIRVTFIEAITKISNMIGCAVDYSVESNVIFSKGKRGRTDLEYGNNVIIEFKANLKNNIDKEISQLLDYVIQREKETKEQFIGILTDGLGVVYVENQKPKKKIELDSAQLDSIFKMLVNKNRIAINAKNIAKDFSIQYSTNGLSLSLAKALYQSMISSKMSQKTEMLFKEWSNLFKLSDEEKGKSLDIGKRRKSLGSIFDINLEQEADEYKALYALQTTYSIIVKLIACKVLHNISFKENIEFFDDLQGVSSTELRDFFYNVEDGYEFQIQGIKNLLEGDFFSWYSDKNQWNSDIYKSIKSILSQLSLYEFKHNQRSVIVHDIFKELYMGTIPKEVRHSLGEYYTPGWLADKVVSDAIKMVNEKEWRGTDPCCGSGTFVVRLLAKVVESCEANGRSSQDTLSHIVSRIYGSDLNPLAVLTTRVNYFINIAHLIDFSKGNVDMEIPVFLGDAAYIPKLIKINEVDCYEYVINNTKIKIEMKIPAEIVANDNFTNMMNRVEKHVKDKDENLVFLEMISLSEHLRENGIICDEIKKFAKILVDLERNSWNSIWARIVMNYLKTSQFKNFNVIVGNPPWVDWKVLPTEYRSKIKEVCDAKHIFSGDKNVGGVNLNICGLIANVVASNWLNRDDGVLAFLMPKSLTTQKSYEGFRSFFLSNDKKERLYLQKIDDWTKAGHPFAPVTEPFLTYYYGSKIVPSESSIKANFIVKKPKLSLTEIIQDVTWSGVKDNFEEKDQFASVLDQTKTQYTFSSTIDEAQKVGLIVGDNLYKFRGGISFTPQGVYYVKCKDVAADGKTILIENYTSESAQKKIPKQMTWIESEYIYPILEGGNVSPFGLKGINNPSYVVFPYEYGRKDPLIEADLLKKSPQTLQYFTKFKDILDNQSEYNERVSKRKSFYSATRVGEYSWDEYIVAVRNNTKFIAMVVPQFLMPWGESKRLMCEGHVPFISRDKQNNKIGKEEAYYLCGILNTSLVKKYVEKSNDGRSFSLDSLMVNIPKFDPKNTQHGLIASIALDISELKINMDVGIMQIEDLYLDMLQKKNSNV